MIASNQMVNNVRRMFEKLKAIKRLYFGLILLSVLCTMTTYLLSVHFCCENRAIQDLLRHVAPLDGSVGINVSPDENRSKDHDGDDLGKYLKFSNEAKKVLTINLKNMASTKDKGTNGNFIFGLERFPGGVDGGRRSKYKGGKTKPSKYRGFFFAFSFSGDQLSAATRRLLKLNALAKYGKRLVVEPLVKDSSFWGDHLSRRKPAMKPLSFYYNMKSVNELLEDNGYARFASRRNFVENCRGRTGTLYVRLLSNAWLRNRVNPKPDLLSLMNKSAEKGWVRCHLPLVYLGDYLIVRQLRVVRQICVNTETAKNFTKLEDEIFKPYKCVVFHHWSGTGKRNGNYFQSQTPTRLPPLELTHLLPFSSEIAKQARSFIANRLRGMPYISVHIRTERFFRTNPNFTENYLRFRMCSEYLVKLVNTLKNSWKIKQTFLTSDLGEQGSNAIARALERISRIDTATVKKVMEDLIDYQNSLIQRLNPATRQVSGNVDRGVEALIDMSILKDGDHLVTVGTGLTWQLWLMDVFRQRQKEREREVYSVVKLC